MEEKTLTFVTLSFQGELPVWVLVLVGWDAPVVVAVKAVVAVPGLVGGRRVGESMDAPRGFVGLTRHNFFVAVGTRFFWTIFPANTGAAARLSDVLISRAKLRWVFARRPAKSCGEPSAATEDAAMKDERAIVARYMVRGLREKGGEEWGRVGDELRGVSVSVLVLM